LQNERGGMMNDLISRQAVLYSIERMKPYHQDADDIMEMIQNFHFNAYTTEKTAEWIDREIDDAADRWKCSKCGRTEQYRENYCPNCGAKMKG
jgi:rubrerythrin